jgi:hypothetical protein
MPDNKEGSSKRSNGALATVLIGLVAVIIVASPDLARRQEESALIHGAAEFGVTLQEGDVVTFLRPGEQISILMADGSRISCRSAGCSVQAGPSGTGDRWFPVDVRDANTGEIRQVNVSADNVVAFAEGQVVLSGGATIGGIPVAGE